MAEVAGVMEIVAPVVMEDNPAAAGKIVVAVKQSPRQIVLKAQRNRGLAKRPPP